MKISGFVISKNNIEVSFKLIDLSANLYIRENKTYFPAVNQKSYAKSDFKGVNPETRKIIIYKVLPVIRESGKGAYPELISNIYYKSSLVLFNSGNFDLAEESLKTSIQITPAVGFLYVELASIYIHQGDAESFERILKTCGQIVQTGTFCNEYLLRYNEYGLYPKPGSLEEVVDQYQLGNLSENTSRLN